MASQKYWMGISIYMKYIVYFNLGWFKGLTSSFLNVKVPKLLFLGEAERMDKELTIAQIQGKFKLIVFNNVGHSIQEDNWKETGKTCYEFIRDFRLPTDLNEVEMARKKGMLFRPNLPKNPFEAKSNKTFL